MTNAQNIITAGLNQLNALLICWESRPAGAHAEGLFVSRRITVEEKSEAEDLISRIRDGLRVEGSSEALAALASLEGRVRLVWDY